MFPLLLKMIPAIHNVAGILSLYDEGHTLSEIKPVTSYPSGYTVKVMYRGKEVDSYTYIPDVGWCLDVLFRVTVVCDYPTTLAYQAMTDIAKKGDVNLARGMRFGALLTSVLLSDTTSSSARREVIAYLRGVLKESPSAASRIKIDGDKVIITV